MHELSIVLSIVDIAQQETGKANAQSVEQIELEIGDLAGVEIKALEFVWSSAVKNTVLENAQKFIHRISAEARCLDCEHQFTLTAIYDACPKCGSYFRDILQGQEMKVKSLTLNT